MLTDLCGRRIEYLRLSVTQRCAMRCMYCRPAYLNGSVDAPELTVEQITLVVRHLVNRHGLRKVRLTGGEPGCRPDLPAIISSLAGLPGLREIAMTTNGMTLSRHARTYHQAGLHRLNVSLDSLRPEAFQRITGVKGLDRVIAGLAAAMEAGLHPIRLNTVVVAGENDRELPDLVCFAAARSMEIRFIELMPMGPLASQWSQRHVTERVMRQRLNPIIAQWQPLPQGSHSARRFAVRLRNGGDATIGFITPMSRHFCAACNRLRLTAGGDVYPCLMDEPRGNIMSALVPQFDLDALDTVIDDALAAKMRRHPVSGFTAMTVLGG